MGNTFLQIKQTLNIYELLNTQTADTAKQGKPRNSLESSLTKIQRSQNSGVWRLRVENRTPGLPMSSIRVFHHSSNSLLLYDFWFRMRKDEYQSRIKVMKLRQTPLDSFHDWFFPKLFICCWIFWTPIASCENLYYYNWYSVLSVFVYICHSPEWAS